MCVCVCVVDSILLARQSSDAAVGSLLVLLSVVIFVYYTLWVIVIVRAQPRRSSGAALRASLCLVHLTVSVWPARPRAAVRRRGPLRADTVPGLVVRDHDPRSSICAARYRHRDLHLAGHDQEPEAEIVVKASDPYV